MENRRGKKQNETFVMDTELFEQILEKVLAYLDYKPRSVSEINRHIDRILKKFGVSADTRDNIETELLKKLDKFSYLNDSKVANDYIQNAIFSTKPRSRGAVYVYLLKKGIPEEVVKREIEIFTDDVELKNMQKEVERKFGIDKLHIQEINKQDIVNYLIQKRYEARLVYEYTSSA
ncbi:RecX family transcriptional regulator [Patescibacteria group bacterium]|nr:RecX family transcriptional regulator [Patescibacteria group bacterium]